MACSVDKPSPVLRLAVLLLSPGAGIAIDGAPASAADLTAPATIARAAEARVRTALALDRGAPTPGAAPARVHVSALPPDPRLRLASCFGGIEARMETAQPEQGRALVRVFCAHPAWSVFVPVRIETEAEVWVAARPLTRGSRPTAADVRLERRLFAGVTENYVKSLDELRRYRLRRPLASGALLARDAFEPAPLVERGAVVTLRAEAGGLRIDAAGWALSEAAPGQRVRVQNAASLKVVEGVVDAAGIVRLEP